MAAPCLGCDHGHLCRPPVLWGDHGTMDELWWGCNQRALHIGETINK